MSANDDEIFDRLIRKLARLATLDQADRDAIRNLPFKLRTVAANRVLVREGERVTTCAVLVSGYTYRHKTTSEGARQIVSFHLPGDILDLDQLLLATADHTLQTITEAVLAWVPEADIRRIIRERPCVNEALWRDTLIDASVFREWVLNVGRRDAKSRIAHMLCEFAARRDAAGLGSPERFELPMTQEQIGDATGLTSIHVNRMLQELARAGVIARDRRDVAITDWARLRAIGGFDPAYLHASV